MAYETKNDTGALFTNDRKEHDRQPDFRGQAVVNGQPMEIAAWRKTSANGKVYLSLKFQAPRERDAAPKADQVPQTDFPF
jgi:uncharacterized protein (DUF736 family)